MSEIPKLIRTLRAVYKEIGPFENGRLVSDVRLAEMTRKKVREKWSYPDIDLAHRIAKALQP